MTPQPDAAGAIAEETQARATFRLGELEMDLITARTRADFAEAQAQMQQQRAEALQRDLNGLTAAFAAQALGCAPRPQRSSPTR